MVTISLTEEQYKIVVDAMGHFVEAAEEGLKFLDEGSEDYEELKDSVVVYEDALKTLEGGR